MNMEDIVLVEGNNELNIQLTPVAKAEFYVPPEMEKSIEWVDVLNYWNHKCWVTITNNGDAPGTHNIHVWDSIGNLDAIIPITLQPGESYTWSNWQWLTWYGNYRVYLEGDWIGNNYSEAIF